MRPCRSSAPYQTASCPCPCHRALWTIAGITTGSPPGASQRGPEVIALKREILISGSPRETRVAILEDDRLVELLVDRPDARRSVGDIYLGKVEAVLPGIQAAFVDIGAEKSAFLHASDLIASDEDDDPSEERDDDDGSDNGNAATRLERGRGRGALPDIADELTRGQTNLVQVIQGPIGTKGTRVTAAIPH